MNKKSREDLEHFKKEDLILIIDMLYKSIDYYKLKIDKAIEYINKYEYQRYCPGPYEKEKYIMREEKEGKNLLDILEGTDD